MQAVFAENAATNVLFSRYERILLRSRTKSEPSSLACDPQNDKPTSTFMNTVEHRIFVCFILSDGHSYLFTGMQKFKGTGALFIFFRILGVLLKCLVFF